MRKTPMGLAVVRHITVRDQPAGRTPSLRGPQRTGRGGCTPDRYSSRRYLKGSCSAVARSAGPTALTSMNRTSMRMHRAVG